jgi:3-oxoadipate enol-lactonase
MPDIDADGCRIHVEIEGPEQAPVLVLSNSLATTLHMWDGQLESMTQRFRVLRYDPRGHGHSGVPAGPYSMERLGRDVLAVFDVIGIRKANWCGLSMGGMVGQWLAANVPERIERLVLSNTSSYFSDKAERDHRLKLVREKGIAAFAAANMERWFTKSFRQRSLVEASEYIKSRIPGAGLIVLDAAHLSNVEQPKAYTNAVLDFLLTG